MPSLCCKFIRQYLSIRIFSILRMLSFSSSHPMRPKILCPLHYPPPRTALAVIKQTVLAKVDALVEPKAQLLNHASAIKLIAVGINQRTPGEKYRNPQTPRRQDSPSGAASTIRGCQIGGFARLRRYTNPLSSPKDFGFTPENHRSKLRPESRKILK